VVWRALRRDPAERYPSMEALCHDLKNLDTVAIPDYPESSSSAASAGAWRQHLPTVGIVTLVLVVLVLAGVAAEMFHRLQLAGR
jgi:ferric-dicitrate binding protein FerR (iron transport regulator)